MKQRTGCVMYSFGSSGDSCFESDFSRLLPNCEVHIFDPTSEEVNGNWTYHKYGLGGENHRETTFWNQRTQCKTSCENCQMKTLKEIMRLLGHTHVDVMKVDIDGAEWRSFDSMFQDFGSTLPISQILLEATGLDIPRIPPTDLRPDVSLLHALRERGFRVFSMEPNLGSCKRRWDTMSEDGSCGHGAP